MDNNQRRYQSPRDADESVEKSRKRLMDEMMMDYLHKRYLGPQPTPPMNENDRMASKQDKPREKA
jgi:hypothetical protein